MQAKVNATGAAKMTTTATLSEEPRDDYITCVRYDYFGRRVATVSADAVLRIRDIDENGMWSVQDGCEIKNTHAVRAQKSFSSRVSKQGCT